MLGCFFARKAPPEVEFLLRVLDTSDIGSLSEMYGEARDGFKNPELMAAVNKRMTECLAPARKEGGGT
ncbi:MAG: hypothetical protein GAK30_02984 [Paracidovorax wautersii]|uniref:Uncharacterized protein n=1 Tax=Paracidovorax wautersii TaxID=1177982 RepID=A0A7V8FM28_9BURK|nr:MAG: hypothetical protein GAK30_02984 [Paracidovorax wautersii]